MNIFPLKQSSRSFTEYVTDLSKYISEYYPDLIPFFTDNAVGQIVYESQAGIASSLTVQIERAMQETRIDYAQSRRNLLTLAKNNGIRIPNVSASVTLVDFTFDVPAEGDSFSKQYLPIIKSGTQVVGAGQVFEVSDDIDFSSPVDSNGLPNRKYVPILDNAQRVVRYEITKREVVFNGSTKIYRANIQESSDFYELIMPDSDVIRVEQVAVMPSNDAPQNPPYSLFFDERYRWYEVSSLSESKIFKRYGQPDSNGFYSGKWVSVDNRYVSDFTPNGFCRVTFGNGRNTKNDFSSILTAENRTNQFIKNILSSNGLGARLASDMAVFVRYRVGGGASSNLPPNALTGFGFTEFSIGGSDRRISDEVLRTARVNNPVPAIGGKASPTNEEIRRIVAYGKPLKEGAVTLSDYRFIARTMDGIFGRPDRISVRLEDNKIRLDIVGVDGNGNYTDSGNGLLKSNLAEYMSNYRMVNDFIEIGDAKVLTIAMDLDILIDGSTSDFALKSEIVQTIKSMVMSSETEIGDDIYLGNLFKEINSINGVINMNSYKIYSVVDTTGAKYATYRPSSMDSSLVSTNGTISKYSVSTPDNILIASRDEIFEVRNDEDIRIFFRRRAF